jgi:proteasome lid subunit RPN8/RPN11
MSERRDRPDVRQLGKQELPSAAFPARRAEFRAYFDAETHAGITRHAAEDTAVEICGVLVGRWEQDEDGPFVAISNYIRCDNASQRAGEVTFTHDAWSKINQEMDTRFVSLKIVGWYHSHPTFGIFLSERDVFIHEHFFSNPGQVAFVVDPRQGTEGLFVWRDGQPKPCGHYWVGNRVQAAPDDREPGRRDRADAAAGGAGPAGGSSPREGSFTSALWYALPLAAALLIGFLLASLKTGWEEQRLIEGTVAHFGLWKGLRPGLREHLAEVAANVQTIRTAVEELAGRHAKLAGDDARNVREAWNQVSDSLDRTQDDLRLLGAVYGHDAAEMAAMKTVLADKLAELAAPKQKSRSGPAEGKAGPKPQPAQPKEPAKSSQP